MITENNFKPSPFHKNLKSRIETITLDDVCSNPEDFQILIDDFDHHLISIAPFLYSGEYHLFSAACLSLNFESIFLNSEFLTGKQPSSLLASFKSNVFKSFFDPRLSTFLIEKNLSHLLIKLLNFISVAKETTHFYASSFILLSRYRNAHAQDISKDNSLLETLDIKFQHTINILSTLQPISYINPTTNQVKYFLQYFLFTFFSNTFGNQTFTSYFETKYNFSATNYFLEFLNNLTNEELLLFYNIFTTKYENRPDTNFSTFIFLPVFCKNNFIASLVFKSNNLSLLPFCDIPTSLEQTPEHFS